MVTQRAAPHRSKRSSLAVTSKFGSAPLVMLRIDAPARVAIALGSATEARKTLHDFGHDSALNVAAPWPLASGPPCVPASGRLRSNRRRTFSWPPVAIVWSSCTVAVGRRYAFEDARSASAARRPVVSSCVSAYGAKVHGAHNVLVAKRVQLHALPCVPQLAKYVPAAPSSLLAGPGQRYGRNMHSGSALAYAEKSAEPVTARRPVRLRRPDQTAPLWPA